MDNPDGYRVHQWNNVPTNTGMGVPFFLFYLVSEDPLITLNLTALSTYVMNINSWALEKHFLI